MKKLIELIKRLLGFSDKSDSDSSSSSGFTLIELLIVIAILGILAAGLLLAIDPAEKLRQGQDTRAINDVSQTASKIEQYAIQSADGVYPTAATVWTVVSQPALINSQYIRPTYVYDAGTNTFYLYITTLRSKKYNATPQFLYNSSQGKTCFTAAGATTCP